jgi:hypothetical protein
MIILTNLMSHLRMKTIGIVTIITGIGLAQSSLTASAAPNAEVAKRCLHYAYIVYPYKRPGAVRMSGDRQAYFKDCMEKNGDVPAPTPTKP